MSTTHRGFRCAALAATVVLAAGCARWLIAGDDVPLREADGYYPQQAWRTSAPEAQGLDSEALIALLDAIESARLPIHSLHIVRYGHLVLDAYVHPFAPGERHDVASVTKSVTTTLVGIALAEGAIADLDAPVYPLLGAPQPADARKLQIRLRHLLTTSSGFDCGHAPYEREMLAMIATDDWVRYALDLPLRESPGARFAYCSPGFHLLSALITRGAGLSAEAYARRALFGPLGIDDLRWPHDPQGVSQGAGDLQLLPHDLLRLGYLFLRQGRWNGRHIVPTAWIDQATRRQVDTPSGEGYGFGWWILRDVPGIYQAAGRGGQRLIVWPAKDIVVVTTGGGFDPAQIAPYLLRSLKSNAALPARPEAQHRLRERVDALARPPAVARAVPVLPARAAAISGIDYAIEANPLDVRSVRFALADPSKAEVRIRLRDGDMVVPLGLDGRYRFGIDPRTGDRVAGRSRWTGPDSFELEIDTIGRINHFTLVCRSEGERLTCSMRERAGLIETRFLGRAAR